MISDLVGASEIAQREKVLASQAWWEFSSLNTSNGEEETQLHCGTHMLVHIDAACVGL